MKGISLAERQMDGLRRSVFGLDGFTPSSDVPWEAGGYHTSSLIPGAAAIE